MYCICWSCFVAGVRALYTLFYIQCTRCTHSCSHSAGSGWLDCTFTVRRSPRRTAEYPRRTYVSTTGKNSLIVHRSSLIPLSRLSMYTYLYIRVCIRNIMCICTMHMYTYDRFLNNMYDSANSSTLLETFTGPSSERFTLGTSSH